MTKAPNMAANMAAAASSAPRLSLARSTGIGTLSGTPPRPSARGRVDPLQHALGPVGGELGLEEHLLHMVAEGRHVRRRHLHALALEEASRLSLGLHHALVVEGLGLGFGGLDRRLLLPGQRVPIGL